MKNISILLVSSFLFISCKKDVKLNKYNLESVNQFAIQCIQRNDSVNFLKLFHYDKSKSEFYKSQAKIVNLNNFKKISKTFLNQKIEIIANDNISLVNNQVISENDYNLYVKVNEDYYKLRFVKPNYSDGNTFNVFYYSNLSKDCTSFKGEPFKPEASIFDQYFMWSLKDNMINSVIGKITNLSDIDIKKIRFRLTARKESVIIFKKTFSVDTVIKKGDVGTVEINNIEYVSMIKLTKKDNIEWDFELIGLLPKPNINPCNKITFLRRKFKK